MFLEIDRRNAKAVAYSRKASRARRRKTNRRASAAVYAVMAAAIFIAGFITCNVILAV